jgi:hypothetical protein
VRAAALARGDAAPPMPSKRRQRRIALLGGVAVALVTAGVVITTASSPPDARAALGQAATRMAAIDSGRVIWTHRAGQPDP